MMALIFLENILLSVVGVQKLFLKTRAWAQSHYREVPQWEIFMEQELRFGMDLDKLALLKKTI